MSIRRRRRPSAVVLGATFGEVGGAAGAADEGGGADGAATEAGGDLVDGALGLAPLLIGIPERRAARRPEMLGADADEADARAVAEEGVERCGGLLVDPAGDVGWLRERARARDRPEVAVAQLQDDRTADHAG